MTYEPAMIQLLYAGSMLSTTREYVSQRLDFALLVRNIAFVKKVVVYWQGKDGHWQQLPAIYQGQAAKQVEHWRAKLHVVAGRTDQLPGDIQFALFYGVDGKEYWDNNQGGNYLLPKDNRGIIANGMSLAHIDFHPLVSYAETIIPVKIAIRQTLAARRVSLRWSTNMWKSFRETDCTPLLPSVTSPLSGRYPDVPKIDDTVIWQGRIVAGDACTVEYAFCCHCDGMERWENNGGLNYRVERDNLRVMTLNLHCFQEPRQDEKFREIARAIAELDVHIICFQEVAEELTQSGKKLKENAAEMIRSHLFAYDLIFHLYWDWSHIGFERYYEGCAILSRFPLLNSSAKYVSSSKDTHDIHSRKVVMAQIMVPCLGLLNVFSVHLSWREEGFQSQFKHLLSWAREESADGVATTLLCGDFNTRADSDDYRQIIGKSGFEDQYLRINDPAEFKRIFAQQAHSGEHHHLHDGRIDYILANRDSGLVPKTSQAIFTAGRYDRVSDHPGYITEFMAKRQSRCGVAERI